MKKIITKNVIYYAITLVLLVGFCSIQFIFPKFGEVMDKQKMIDDLKDQVSQETSKQQSLMQSASKKLPVDIYKASYPGLDLENSAVDLVDEFVQMIRQTNNKIVEISFTSKPLQLASAEPTATATSAASATSTASSATTGSSSASTSSTPPVVASPPPQTNCGIVTLNLTLDNSYLSLQNLLRKIYNWKYLAAIKDVVINPDSSDNQSQNNGSMSDSTNLPPINFPNSHGMGSMSQSVNDSLNAINKTMQAVNSMQKARDQYMRESMEEGMYFGPRKKPAKVTANGLITKLTIDLYITKS